MADDHAAHAIGTYGGVITSYSIHYTKLYDEWLTGLMVLIISKSRN